MPGTAFASCLSSNSKLFRRLACSPSQALPRRFYICSRDRLGMLLINFCVILEVPGQSKTTISFERVVKIIFFVIFASGVALNISFEHLFRPAWALLGALDLIFRPFWSFFGGPNISVLMYASIDVRMYGCMTILKRKRKQR